MTLYRTGFFRFPLAAPSQIAYSTSSQADMAQLVEHNLAKVGVAGSSPVVRSIACREPVLLESALFISAKWPSGKAEACKAFTPGSNPGVASIRNLKARFFTQPFHWIRTLCQKQQNELIATFDDSVTKNHSASPLHLAKFLFLEDTQYENGQVLSS